MWHPRATLSIGLELESLSGSGNWSLHSAVGQSELWRIGITAIPDNQITCPLVLVGFGLLQGLGTTLLIRQVTETLTPTPDPWIGWLLDATKALSKLQLSFKHCTSCPWICTKPSINEERCLKGVKEIDHSISCLWLPGNHPSLWFIPH